MKPQLNILVWAGWYPTNENDSKGIFIQKHVEIISRQHNVHLFTIQPHGTKKFGWHKKFTRISDNRTEAIYTVPRFSPLKFFFLFWLPLTSYIRFRSKVKKVDVFHMHASYPFVLFSIPLRLMCIRRWVLTEHWSGYMTNDGAYDRLAAPLRFIVRKLLKGFKGTSVVSQLLMDEMRQRDLLPGKAAIIPNKIVFPRHPPKRRPYQHGHRFHFCTILHLASEQKNVAGMIQAIKLLRESDHNIALNIYGDGPDAPKLKALAQNHGLLGEYVVFHGSVPNKDVPKVYAENHAYVVFSLFETFSIAAAEAITHGLPVVSSRCGGPQSFVDESNGLLVEEGNINALSAAMVQIASNYAIYTPEKLWENMKARFSEEAIAKGFNDLLYH